jgi:hypothetical protein
MIPEHYQRGVMQGWEHWWAREVAARFGGPNKTQLSIEHQAKFHLAESATRDNLKVVDEFLATRLKDCGGDLFKLLGQIMDEIGWPDGGEPVVEVDVDLEDGEHAVRFLPGYEEALTQSHVRIALAQHPARFIDCLAQQMLEQRQIIAAEHKALGEELATLDAGINLVRGRGRRPRK